MLNIVTSEKPLQATNTEYEEHKGRIAIGRLHAGVLTRGMEVRVRCTAPTSALVQLKFLP